MVEQFHGTGRADQVRLSYITKNAEKTLAALAVPDRRRVTEKLIQPVQGSRFKPVGCATKYGVVRFNVSRSLRVTCRHTNGNMCVLHVGTHPEADRWAANYNGHMPQQLIRICDSKVVRMCPAVVVTSGKQCADAKTVQELRVETSDFATAVVEPGDLQQIGSAFLTMCGKLLKVEQRRTEQQLFDMEEMLREERETALSAYEVHEEEERATLRALEEHWGQKTQDLSRRIVNINKSLQTGSSNLQALRAEQEQLAQQFQLSADQHESWRDDSQRQHKAHTARQAESESRQCEQLVAVMSEISQLSDSVDSLQLQFQRLQQTEVVASDTCWKPCLSRFLQRFRHVFQRSTAMFRRNGYAETDQTSDQASGTT